jgi:hypothetical protein
MADTPAAVPAAAPHRNLFREFLHSVAAMLPGLGQDAQAEVIAAIDQHIDEHDALAAAAAPAPEGTQP